MWKFCGNIAVSTEFRAIDDSKTCVFHTRKLEETTVVYVTLLCLSPARVGSIFLIPCSINSSMTEVPMTTNSTTNHWTTSPGYSTTMPPTTSLPLSKCKKHEEKISYMDSSNCTSVAPLTKSLCYGGCNTSVIFDIIRGTSISNCSCCKPVNTQNVQTQLRCPDGSKKTFSYLTFKKCSCWRCDRSAFTDVPLLKSASSDET